MPSTAQTLADTLVDLVQNSGCKLILSLTLSVHVVSLEGLFIFCLDLHSSISARISISAQQCTMMLQTTLHAEKHEWGRCSLQDQGWTASGRTTFLSECHWGGPVQEPVQWGMNYEKPCCPTFQASVCSACFIVGAVGVVTCMPWFTSVPRLQSGFRSSTIMNLCIQGLGMTGSICACRILMHSSKGLQTVTAGCMSLSQSCTR